MYPTTAELVAASASPELLGLTAPQQDALRAAAIVSVERYTGQKFVEFDGLSVERSNGSRAITLSRRLRVFRSLSIAGIAEALYGPTEVGLSDDGDRLFLLSDAGLSYYSQALLDVQARDSRTYRRGFPTGEVTIDGEWGWEDSPDGVDQAIRIDMEEQAAADASKLSGAVSSYRRLGITDISQGNLRVTMGDPATVSPRVAHLLEDYVWTAGGGLLV